MNEYDRSIPERTTTNFENGRYRLQAIFGKDRCIELCDIAIKLSVESMDDASYYVEEMIKDACRGESFEDIWSYWSAKAVDA